MKKYSETSNAIADMRDLNEQELKKASGGCGPHFCGDPDGEHGFHGPIPAPAPAPIPVQIVGVGGGDCFHGGCHGGEWGGFHHFEEERFFRFHHRRHCGC